MTGQTSGQTHGQTAGQTRGQTASQTRGQTAGQTSGQTRGQTRLLIAVLLALTSAACARRSAATPPSNDLLIVGYDREPDTLNRFSTHILEDIQTCVVEGLTTTDENMNVIPLLAAQVPTIENGGVRLGSDGGMEVTWTLRPGVAWHDGTPFT